MAYVNYDQPIRAAHYLSFYLFAICPPHPTLPVLPYLSASLSLFQLARPTVSRDRHSLAITHLDRLIQLPEMDVRRRRPAQCAPGPHLPGRLIDETYIDHDMTQVYGTISICSRYMPGGQLPRAGNTVRLPAARAAAAAAPAVTLRTLQL